MAKINDTYPVSLDVDYQGGHDRLSSFFRLIWAIPILVILCVLTAEASGVGGGLACATALMIVFRQVYPRWWFDFGLELNRFSTRVFAYLFLLTDKYPSTVDRQSIHLDYKYPDTKQDLNRWLPLIKWLLAIPHYVVLALLLACTLVVTLIAWFAILFTGIYPKGLFEFVVGVMRWAARVNGYAFMLVTDKYPPFSLS